MAEGMKRGRRERLHMNAALRPVLLRSQIITAKVAKNI